jgi:hypothetical protein
VTQQHTVVDQDGRRLLVWPLTPGSVARQARAALREVLNEAGVGGEPFGDAELMVAELAANAELHGRGPCELRIILSEGLPTWCEIVDSLPGLKAVRDRLLHLEVLRRQAAPTGHDRPSGDLVGSALLTALADLTDPPQDDEEDLPRQDGRGLLLVHHLSGGRCTAYLTHHTTTGHPAKAVGFALPCPAPTTPALSRLGPALDFPSP